MARSRVRAKRAVRKLGIVRKNGKEVIVVVVLKRVRESVKFGNSYTMIGKKRRHNRI